VNKVFEAFHLMRLLFPSAAHCLQYKNVETILQPNELTVLLGRHNLDISEDGSVEEAVRDIEIHPDWKIHDDKWNADIAILTLAQRVKFSHFIRPVCLSADDSIESFDDGTVIGWGKSESGAFHEKTPREVNLKAVNDSICLTSEPLIATISTLNTFCASGENAGPCHGDSGTCTI
jgi:hypothetical protein